MDPENINDRVTSPVLPPLDPSTPEKSKVKAAKSDTPSFKSVLPKGTKYAGRGKMSLSPTRSLKIIHRGKSLSPGGRGRGIRKVISVVFWIFKIFLSVVFSIGYLKFFSVLSFQLDI